MPLSIYQSTISRAPLPTRFLEEQVTMDARVQSENAKRCTESRSLRAYSWHSTLFRETLLIYLRCKSICSIPEFLLLKQSDRQTDRRPLPRANRTETIDEETHTPTLHLDLLLRDYYRILGNRGQERRRHPSKAAIGVNINELQEKCNTSEPITEKNNGRRQTFDGVEEEANNQIFIGPNEKPN